MSKRANGNEDLFPGLKVPEPAEDLRDQVLSRARQAMMSAPRRDLWARLWESRPARVAWGTSIVVLVVGHLVVPPGDSRPATGPSELVRAESAGHEELADIVNLPRLSLDARPNAGAVLAIEEGEAEPDGENAS
jgi:hypothetical protein